MKCLCQRARSQMIALSRLPHSRVTRTVLYDAAQRRKLILKSVGQQYRTSMQEHCQNIDELANDEAGRGRNNDWPRTFFNAKRTFGSEPSPKFVDGFRKVQKLWSRCVFVPHEEGI